jgi:hypothetical protein
MREPEDCPWLGRQPRYERLVRLAPARFGLLGKLPSGHPITVPLGNRLPADAGWGWISVGGDCEDRP